MRSLNVAAAVAAALAASSAAHAIGPDEFIYVSLVISGSSAQRDIVRNELWSLCQGYSSSTTITRQPIIEQTTFPYSGSGSSFNTYFADDPALRGGPNSPTVDWMDPDWDFRAYTCKLRTGVATSVIPTALQGQNVAVYYRSEGGSVYGVGPIAKNISVLRLNIDATATNACHQWTTATTAGEPTNAFYCPVTGYNPNNDTASGAVVSAATELGVTDVEPLQFRGENWPAISKLGTQPTVARLTTLTNSAVVATGTVFGVAVSTMSGSPTVTNLSRRQIGDIFSGNVSDWSGLVNYATGNAYPAGTITVCRREAGSGTQIQAGIYFLHQGCGGLSFVTAPSGPGGNPVFNKATTEGVRACLADHPGSIGILGYDAITNGGYTFISIDGIAPSKVAAANGQYGDAFESMFIPVSGVVGNTGSLALTLRNSARLQSSVNSTTVGTYLSPLNATPWIPINVNKPVSLFTYSKDSCAP